MFNIENYPYDEKHNCHVVAGEAMIFHCHHYLNYLQRSILDADYIESRPFLIGSAADAVCFTNSKTYAKDFRWKSLNQGPLMSIKHSDTA